MNWQDFKIFSYAFDFCLFCWIIFFAWAFREITMHDTPYQQHDNPYHGYFVERSEETPLTARLRLEYNSRAR